MINFFPLENRDSLYMDLSVSLRAIISQRLVKKKDGKRAATVEVLLNSHHIHDLIERGDIPALKEAMEQSLAPGSQTFEQDLFRLYRSETITLEEALRNADSPTNLSWLINNEAPARPIAEDTAENLGFESSLTTADGPSYQEFTLSLYEGDTA